MSEIYQIIISGTVQGVFFRAKAKTHADRLGLKGLAQNLDDGTVEIRIAATKDEAKQFIEALYTLAPPIEIKGISMKKIPSSETYITFKIIH